ncbi:hypothetical protein BD779DRAFT_1542851 [Infundibulicybe gibba]|nr:hypothetical protein BD779DRAFT_1542851 [Infundibulicybe gibba]
MGHTTHFPTHTSMPHHPPLTRAPCHVAIPYRPPPCLHAPPSAIRAASPTVRHYTCMSRHPPPRCEPYRLPHSHAPPFVTAIVCLTSPKISRVAPRPPPVAFSQPRSN